MCAWGARRPSAHSGACTLTMLRCCRLIQPMLHELQSLTAAKEGHSTAMNVGAGVLGSRILQILEVTSAIVIPPPPKRTPYSVSPRLHMCDTGDCLAQTQSCYGMGSCGREAIMMLPGLMTFLLGLFCSPGSTDTEPQSSS